MSNRDCFAITECVAPGHPAAAHVLHQKSRGISSVPQCLQSSLHSCEVPEDVIGVVVVVDGGQFVAEHGDSDVQAAVGITLVGDRHQFIEPGLQVFGVLEGICKLWRVVHHNGECLWSIIPLISNKGRVKKKYGNFR